MKQAAGVAAMVAMFLVASTVGRAQTIVNPSGQRIMVAGQEAAPVAETRKLNDKQRVLADQTDRLLSMVSELKVQVDMTNKNILSMKVVRKAEEIEFFAHQMKGQAKK